ncbi:uncharacterized protein LOC131842355 [Achroia grisella]|uniref:uncharacterized protein LOC131842355 n=1 Tax=Achroia grisella TaxID=688607 RepID=UPI0027D24489|nr:uncharacterized protein LOC131842355 [Achroia grisella]
MSTLLIFLLVIAVTKSESNVSNCNGFTANFHLKSITGPWQVVAIIPEKLFPDKDVACFKVEFSETDEGGLRWLVNKTLSMPHKMRLETIKGPIVRQRYHADHPFDVWSRSVEDVNGCFQQVLSLDTDKSDLYKAVTHDVMMQLHQLDAADGSEPFLVQMLWGRMIAAVIYRRQPGVTQDQLKPVFELMSKLRGPQRVPRICELQHDFLVRKRH